MENCAGDILRRERLFSYEPPAVVDLGGLQDLTQGGVSNIQPDCPGLNGGIPFNRCSI